MCLCVTAVTSSPTHTCTPLMEGMNQDGIVAALIVTSIMCLVAAAAVLVLLVIIVLCYIKKQGIYVIIA